MRAIITSVGPLGAGSATAIAANQVVTGAAAMTLTSSTVTLSPARRVLITSVGNDSGITFTIVGTTYGGTSVTDVVTGTNGSSAYSAVDFLTVTSITTSGSTSASGASAGTNAVAGSTWVRLDDWAPGPWTVQVNVSGTINYTVQTTLDDPNDPTNPVSIQNVTWFSSTDTNLVNASASKAGTFSGGYRYVRVLQNSGTGTATATVLQNSNGPI
jgi:hypothetical protein